MCMYMYVYVCVYVRVRVCVCVCVYICIYTCICIYMYILLYNHTLGHYLQIRYYCVGLLKLYILLLHLIVLELPNLNCHILSQWATFMYIAFYFILYFIFYFLESSRQAAKYNKPV